MTDNSSSSTGDCSKMNVYKAVYDPSRSTSSLYLVVARVPIEALKTTVRSPPDVHPLKKYYCTEDKLQVGTEAIYELPAASVLMRAQYEPAGGGVASTLFQTDDDVMRTKQSAAVLHMLSHCKLPAWSASLKSKKFSVLLCKAATMKSAAVPRSIGVSLTPQMAIRRKLNKKYIESYSPRCLFSKSAAGGYCGPYYVYADSGELLLRGAYKFGLCDGTWQYAAVNLTVNYSWDAELALQEAFRVGDRDSVLRLLHSKWDDCYGRLHRVSEETDSII